MNTQQAETNREVMDARIEELKSEIDTLGGNGVDARNVRAAAEELTRLLPGDGIHGPTGYVNPGAEGLPNPEPAQVQRVS